MTDCISIDRNYYGWCSSESEIMDKRLAGLNKTLGYSQCAAAYLISTEWRDMGEVPRYPGGFNYLNSREKEVTWVILNRCTGAINYEAGYTITDKLFATRYPPRCPTGYLYASPIADEWSYRSDTLYSVCWRWCGPGEACSASDPKNLGDCGISSLPIIGNPINVATGNKLFREIDYSSTSWLGFSRHYNSMGLGASHKLGHGWRSSLSRNIVVTPRLINVFRPDGKLFFFSMASTGSWYSDADIPDHLLELKDEEGASIGWQYRVAADHSVETYSSSGKLLSITDRSGRSQFLTYDLAVEEGGDGDPETLDRVSDDMGRQLTFSYDVQKRIATLTDPAGGLYRYSYDAHGNLRSVTYPDGGVRSYHYNEPAYTSGANLPSALTGITDENGVRFATYQYDAQGRAIATEHADGADRHQLTYNPDGSTTVTDPLGTQRIHQFQTILGVVKSAGQSQPGGAGCGPASSATSYDANGNVASQTDFNGNQTCYAFDLARNLEIARIEGLSANQACPADPHDYTPAANTAERAILTEWHPSFRLPVRITEAERETALEYDQYGNLTRYSLHDRASHTSRSWTTNYLYHPDVPGALIQSVVDGPRTDVADTTTFDYFAPDENCLGGHYGCRGQIRQITNALGHVTQIARYNAHGQPEVIIDPNGLVSTLVYDARQRLLARAIGGETTRYDYDAAGQLIKLTLPDGNAMRYRYDAAHRLTQIADNLGNRIDYTLDAMGNRIREEVFDPANVLTQTRQREFDALSRLWKAIGAHDQITELGYDANGNLKQSRNPLAHSSTYQFDTLDRLIRINDPAGGLNQQGYDKQDRLVSVTDPKGVITAYSYNGLGDLLHEVSPDRGATTYTYDTAGNLIMRTDARGVIETITYDALNRPIRRNYTTVAGVFDTAPISWHYDEGTYAIGRLARMQDESGNTNYQYDQQGRLLSQTQTIVLDKESATHTLSYQYDSAGRLTQMTYPSGAQIALLYGNDGRPVEMQVNDQVLIRNLTYQPFGAPKSWLWGNGQRHNRDFDRDGRLIQHPLAEGTQAITYDAASRLTQTTHTNPLYNRSYGYDALDQLIHQATSTSSTQWHYDANGNRTHVQPGSSIYPYTVDTANNHLITVAGPIAKSYTYDAVGNPLTDGLTHYSWNAANRLSEVTIKGSVVYRYNGHGERVVKAGDPRSKIASTFFVYNPAGQLIGEYEASKGQRKNGNAQIKQETVWLDDIPIAVLKSAAKNDAIEISYIQADQLNTPRVIVDQNHTPIWRWDNIDPFGANLPDEDPDGDRKLFEYNLRFAGQYFDSETQLHYNYFRDYDPNTGRYLQSDPIGLAGGLNPYGYVFNNPLHYTDPTGEAVPAIALWMVGGALTLLDMLQPIQPHPQFPDALESVWTIPGPVGGAKRLCGSGDGVAKGRIPKNKSLVPFDPPNDGFLGAPRGFTLLPGARIDRIGFDGGRFLSPAGTPMQMRALRPGAETRPLRIFEVVKPLNVRAGEIAPAYGRPGLGTQFVTDRPVRELLHEGFLRSIGQ